MGSFDESYTQKVYSGAHRKDDVTVTIASISRNIGSKLKELEEIVSTPGINIAPEKDPSITSGLTHDASEDDYYSLLGGASLAIDPAVDIRSLLGDNAYLKGEDVYPPDNESLRASTATGHTRYSKFKQAVLFLTQ